MLKYIELCYLHLKHAIYKKNLMLVQHIIKRFKNVHLYTAGVSNPRPAGHMRPTVDFDAALTSIQKL